MHPDNAAPLILAARRRRELARAKAVRALRELDRAGTPVTFQTVARAAGVSRSWLYNQPDLRAEIHRLRAAIVHVYALPAVQFRQRHIRGHNPRPVIVPHGRFPSIRYTPRASSEHFSNAPATPCLAIVNT